MSTAVSVWLVKQSLLLKLEQAGQKLKELVLALPEELGIGTGGKQVRAGVLELGRGSLQAFRKAAPLHESQAERKHCEEPMRHKGYVSGPLVTTLGDIRIGRQVEGACKSLVGGRCKQAGIRNWTRQDAAAVLRLRPPSNPETTTPFGPTN